MCPASAEEASRTEDSVQSRAGDESIPIAPNETLTQTMASQARLCPLLAHRDTPAGQGVLMLQALNTEALCLGYSQTYTVCLPTLLVLVWILKSKTLSTSVAAFMYSVNHSSEFLNPRC